MAAAVLIIVGVGVFLRFSLFGTSIAEWFAGRNEVTTPITSWKRVIEGLSLHKAGVSPYLGDIFHQIFLEWARLMNLGRDEHAYREMRDWIIAFEQNPKKWTKYYGWQVTMRRYEDIYGNVLHYNKKKSQNDISTK